VEEGTSNGVFLSKDLSSGPTIYPLPTGAKKYKNINSKRKGGPKIKVRESEELWYHGSPELQKIGGQFEGRTMNISYLSDPDQWKKLQDDMATVESGSPEYMQMNDAAQKLTVRKSVRSPIFLSNRHSVANTYADDARAFDYQSAEPGVLAVTVAPGKTLTIMGLGQNFRGIAIQSVRDGLSKAGIDEATIERALAQFTNQIRGDGSKISTNSLAAIVDGLGFDIIDVTRIKDNYTGDGPPATVRMVMNPSLIQIKR
jgi:hypothetical protein